ncbi:hypothetical protein [Streptomyces wuyuanensis]|uniref:hypothetical protein n=1 Tax=Streptomyces wuyuanensis TaxID=1196353 RepID=UPI00342D89F0
MIIDIHGHLSPPEANGLFGRFPRIAPADPQAAPAWMEVPFPAFRGLTELQVVLEPAAS